MSTLTSSSTLAQIKAAYDDNASYYEDGSVTKAKAFITACRFLLRRIPASASESGQNRVDFDMGLIQKEMADAMEFVAANASSSSGSAKARVIGFENFRD